MQRLIDAGAIILGKTNIPAFSLDSARTFTSWDGVTLNAVNPEYVPGASSAGTATAVAAGFAVWGVAEETGGSIQNPTAAQSLIGVKTTCVQLCLCMFAWLLPARLGKGCWMASRSVAPFTQLWGRLPGW